MGEDAQMGLEGFDHQGEGSVQTESAVAADPAADEVNSVPALIRYWVESWPRYVGIIRDAESAVGSLRSEERAIFGETGSAWTWDPLDRESIGSLGRNAIAAVTAFALKELCNSDSTVFSEYQARELIEDCGCLRNPERPDFLLYWNALNRRYGNGAGAAAGKRLAAKRVRDALNFYTETRTRRCTPILDRGGVLFDIGYSWVEKEYSGGGYSIRYNSQEFVQKLLKDLETILGMGAVSWAHAQHFRYGGMRSTIKLPLRIDVAGWRWTLLKERTKLWVPQDFALELRAILDDLSPEIETD